MTTVRKPVMKMPITGAKLPVANAAQRMLLIAQKTDAGTGTADVVSVNPSQAQIKADGGVGGMGFDAADMVRSINAVTPMDVIWIDDPTTTPAASVKSILFAGTATGTGTLTIRAGSERNGKVDVSVIVGMTDEQAQAAVVTAFATKTDCVATVTENGVAPEQADFTFNHAGLEGNYMPLSISGYVPGLTYSVAQDTVGAGAVDATTILDVIGNTRYNAIISPIAFGTAYLSTFLEARWNVENKIMDGFAVVTDVDTKANLITSGDAINFKTIRYCGAKQETRAASYHGPDTFENPLAVSGMVAALSTLRLTRDEDVSSYVSGAVDQSDLFGGAHMASLPYFNTPTPLPAQDIGFGFEDSEVTELNDAGIFVIGNNIADNTMLLGEVLTTYKTDTSGDPDVSFKFANYVDESSQAREYLMTNLRSTFGQTRLTNGNLVGSHTMANEDRIRAKTLGFCADLSGDGYVLLEAGPEAKEYIDTNMVITIDKPNGIVKLTLKLPFVTQLREIQAPIEIVFNI